MSSRICAALLLTAALWSSTIDSRAQSARQLAVRLDPTSAIIDAFASYPVVALGEGPHGNEQGHAFRLALIRDPRFAAQGQSAR